MTQYGLDSSENESLWGQYFPSPSSRATRPNQPPVQWAPQIKQLWHRADHPPPFSTKDVYGMELNLSLLPICACIGKSCGDLYLYRYKAVLVGRYRTTGKLVKMLESKSIWCKKNEHMFLMLHKYCNISYLSSAASCWQCAAYATVIPLWHRSVSIAET